MQCDTQCECIPKDWYTVKGAMWYDWRIFETHAVLVVHTSHVPASPRTCQTASIDNFALTASVACSAVIAENSPAWSTFSMDVSNVRTCIFDTITDLQWLSIRCAHPAWINTLARWPVQCSENSCHEERSVWCGWACPKHARERA